MGDADAPVTHLPSPQMLAGCGRFQSQAAGDFPFSSFAHTPFSFCLSLTLHVGPMGAMESPAT